MSALLASLVVLAAEPSPPVAAPPAPQAVPQAQPAPNQLPARTPVILRVEQAVTSRSAARGDRFPISVVYDLKAPDGRIAIPAGARGEGEVVHAARKSWGGRAGELLLAARFVEVGGQRIQLEAMQVARSGNQQVGAAFVAGVAIPIASFFVTGTSAEVAAGQLAQARLAQPFTPAE